MRTILEFDIHNNRTLPVQFKSDDVRFSDSFAEYFIEHFTKPDDMVFDPFAGFGTTLFAAEKLGRKVFGIEYLPDRAEYIKTNLKNPDGIICENSLKMDKIDMPKIDFLLTSPPYMQKTNHPEYPFAGYQVTGQNYEDYLNDIANIFKQAANKMVSNAYIVIEISNLIIDNEFTPLAWDVARSINHVLPLKHEIIIKWLSDTSPACGFGFDHSYALIFRTP